MIGNGQGFDRGQESIPPSVFISEASTPLLLHSTLHLLRFQAKFMILDQVRRPNLPPRTAWAMQGPREGHFEAKIRARLNLSPLSCPTMAARVGLQKLSIFMIFWPFKGPLPAGPCLEGHQSRRIMT